MSKLGTITRRTFLVASAAVAGGVVFGTYQLMLRSPQDLQFIKRGSDRLDVQF